MHGYFFMKLRRAFVLSRMATVLIVVNLLLLIFSPLAARVAAREAIMPWAYLLNYAAYCWLGFMFLFCSVIRDVDAGRLLRWAGADFFPEKSGRKRERRKKPSARFFLFRRSYR